VKRAALAAAAALLVGACAGDGNTERSTAVIVTTTSTATPTTTPSEESSDDTVSATTTTTSTTAPPVVGDPRVTAVEIARFDRPVDLVPRPGDDALFVLEQRGRIVRWRETGSTTALDLTGRVADGGEQGVLGLAFSPDGARAYVDSTATDGSTTIAEYAVDSDGVFDPSSERTLLVVPQPYANHNAGDLAVDGDGLLYVTLGDGGSGGDPQRFAHDPTTLLGSLLRIDPTPSADAPYTIPADNPFADGPLRLDDGTVIAGAPEVFAWGLRNPWKIAIDPVTGELWIADVGQNEYEEIDVVGPSGGRAAGWGHDFGWSAFEGTERFNSDVADSGRTTPPVLTYPHGADGCSISGGEPYRGTAIAELAPAYVYSDYCSGVLWALDLVGSRTIVLMDGFEGVTAVRSDATGELYVLEAGGSVYRLVPA
jgi:glucose/arabinose dehydrogenase